MNYCRKERLFYVDQRELTWLTQIKTSSCKHNLKYKNIMLNQKKLYNEFLNNPVIKKFDMKLCRLKSSENSIQKIKLRKDTLSNINFAKISGWRRELLLNIDSYLKKNYLIKNEVISLQFIGSIGSKNPISYSDFDCVVILPLMKSLNNNLNFKIKKLMRKLRYFSLQFDPIQHHDIFILTEDELIGGVKPFYPLSLFEYSWGYGRNHFYTSKNNLYPGNRINFLKNNQYFRSLSHNNITNISLYSFKYILSSAFMTPVYFYNFKNIYGLKSELIKKALREHGLIKSNFDLISNYRLKWPQPKRRLIKKLILKSGLKYLTYERVNYLNKRIEYYFHNQKIKLYRNDINTIVSKCLEISNYFAKILLRKNY